VTACFDLAGAAEARVGVQASSAKAVVAMISRMFEFPHLHAAKLTALGASS